MNILNLLRADFWKLYEENQQMKEKIEYIERNKKEISDSHIEQWKKVIRYEKLLSEYSVGVSGLKYFFTEIDQEERQKLEADNTRLRAELSDELAGRPLLAKATDKINDLEAEVSRLKKACADYAVFCHIHGFDLKENEE